MDVSPWTWPKLGEPRISVSLLFYVFSVFMFLQYILCVPLLYNI